MAKRVSDMELAIAQKRGAQVTRPALKVEFPELIALIEQYHGMKEKMRGQYQEKWEKKLAKMDELIKAISNIKLEAGPGGGNEKQLLELGKLILSIKKEHSTVQAEHKALASMAHTHEPCNYKVTGVRDQRGLIDIEKGLLFEVVK